MLTTPSSLETAHFIRALDRVLGALLYLSVLGVRGGPGVVALLGHAALTDHWSALTLLHHGADLHPPLHSSTSRHQQLSNILVAWPRQQQPSYLLASLPCCGSLRPAASSRRGPASASAAAPPAAGPAAGGVQLQGAAGVQNRVSV